MKSNEEREIMMGIFDGLFLAGLFVADKVYEVKDKIAPYVEVGADIATGKAFMDAAQEQANEDIAILNKVNEKNGQIVQETNELIDKTQKDYIAIIKKTYEQKKITYDYLVKPYIDLIEPIKRFMAKTPQITNINAIDNLEVLKYEDMHRSEYKCNTMLHILTSSQALGFGTGIVESVKASIETDKAKEETARLKAEQEKMIARCKSIIKVTEFMEEAYTQVENLKTVAFKQIKRMESLIRQKGQNIDNYSYYDLLLLTETGNIIDLLISIITTHLTNEEGMINPVYKRYIRQIREKNYDKDR